MRARTPSKITDENLARCPQNAIAHRRASQKGSSGSLSSSLLTAVRGRRCTEAARFGLAGDSSCGRDLTATETDRTEVVTTFHLVVARPAPGGAARKALAWTWSPIPPLPPLFTWRVTGTELSTESR